MGRFACERAEPRAKPPPPLLSCQDTPGEQVKREVFDAEISRQVLLDDAAREDYVRRFVEPSLQAGRQWANLDILDREPSLVFLRETLPLEWLRRFPDLPVEILERLFDMAARYGDREGLRGLIRQRCRELDEGTLPHRREAQRAFWFLRDFWFSDGIDDAVWAYMARDPDVVLWLERRRDRGQEGDPVWAPLTAEKIERIRMTYLPHWPPVPLPSSWGTGNPKPETAYRYLRDIVYQIGHDSRIPAPDAM